MMLRDTMLYQKWFSLTAAKYDVGFPKKEGTKISSCRSLGRAEAARSPRDSESWNQPEQLPPCYWQGRSGDRDMDFDEGPAVLLPGGSLGIVIIISIISSFLSHLSFISFYYLYHYHHAVGPARGSEPRDCKKSRRSSLCSSSTGSFSWTRYLFFRLRVFRT